MEPLAKSVRIRDANSAAAIAAHSNSLPTFTQSAFANFSSAASEGTFLDYKGLE